MKAILIEKPWDVKAVEREIPTINDDEALIKVKAAGICGSDIGAFRGVNNLVSYPRIIGHEIVGEIVKIGKNNPKNFKVGDRVVVDPYLYCGHCYPCSIGRTNCCEDLKVLGVHVDGGMAEYYKHPANMLIALPEGLSYEMAALAEPLTISLHGVHRGKVAAGEFVAFYGAGPIGILAALAAKLYGATPIVIDLVQERLDFVKSLGVQYIINSKDEDVVAKIKEITGGKMCQCVMEATGANACIRQALDIVCNAGRIVYTGWPKKTTELPTDLFTKKELDIRGARTSAGEFEEALEIIANNKMPVGAILTKCVSVDEAADTIVDIEKNPGSYMKVVVTF
ncbi:MAG: zinc-binding alcohol dehydrogenase family protein [Sphaerochaetaceae bacterium]|nr:zinc-binding alcohol dehydrogenase family protein [Sphaerochaetaceae bacterium]